jgi:hypothetical protein
MNRILANLIDFPADAQSGRAAVAWGSCTVDAVGRETGGFPMESHLNTP